MGWQAVTPRHDRLDKVGLLGGVLRTIKHADTGLDRYLSTLPCAKSPWPVTGYGAVSDKIN